MGMDARGEFTIEGCIKIAWMMGHIKSFDACVLVPIAFTFSRTVAGQIPTGWHAGRYGTPDEIIAQVDRATPWALVCTAEALDMSNITDLYKLYKYMHPSEVGTCLGSGMPVGGTESLAKMFKDHREEKEVQNDIFQETSPVPGIVLTVVYSFINTTSSWINLLPVFPCPAAVPSRFLLVLGMPQGCSLILSLTHLSSVTALQSLEIVCDTLLSGKAKVMIAGGFETEFAMDRESIEMSRFAATTRDCHILDCTLLISCSSWELKVPACISSRRPRPRWSRLSYINLHVRLITTCTWHLAMKAG
jgi:fatty acid synthase subunit alpha